MKMNDFSLQEAGHCFCSNLSRDLKYRLLLHAKPYDCSGSERVMAELASKSVRESYVIGFKNE